MKAYQVGKYDVYAARCIEEAISLHPKCHTTQSYPPKELPDDWSVELMHEGWPVMRTARQLLDAHGDKPGWLCISNDW